MFFEWNRILLLDHHVLHIETHQKDISWVHMSYYPEGEVEVSLNEMKDIG